MTQLEILTNSGTTKVEVTILHTDIIATIGIILDSERWCKTLAKNIKFLYQNLYIASRHLWILTLTLTNLSLNLNTEFTAKFVGTITKFSIVSLIEYKLSQTITIAKINEGHTSHLTTSLYPSGECYNTTGILEPKLTTSLTSVHI